MDTPTQADLLREWIDKKLDENPKFYSTSSNVKTDRINFVNAHPELKTNENNIKSSHNRIISERLKARKLNPKDHKVSRKKLPKFQTSDMDATVEPQPQGQGQQQTQPSQNTTDPNNKFAPSTNQSTGEGFAPTQPINNFDEEGVAASINAFYLFLKWQYPTLELLTPEEKKSLGKMWLPAFQRYLTEKWAVIGIPLFATLGMVMPKVAKARADKKEKETKEKSEKSKKEDEKKD